MEGMPGQNPYGKIGFGAITCSFPIRKWGFGSIRDHVLKKKNDGSKTKMCVKLKNISGRTFCTRNIYYRGYFFI